MKIKIRAKIKICLAIRVEICLVILCDIVVMWSRLKPYAYT